MRVVQVSKTLRAITRIAEVFGGSWADSCLVFVRAEKTKRQWEVEESSGQGEQEEQESSTL